MKKYYIGISSFISIILLGLNAEMSFVSADQDIMKQKCTKCHGLKNPESYSKAEWKRNVERMAQRSSLTPEEIKNIIKLNKKN